MIGIQGDHIWQRLRDSVSGLSFKLENFQWFEEALLKVFGKDLELQGI